MVARNVANLTSFEKKSLLSLKFHYFLDCFSETYQIVQTFKKTKVLSWNKVQNIKLTLNEETNK